MRVSRARRWVLLLVAAVLISGCWDRRELEERANVLASGVDLCSEEQSCQIIATRQIAIPGRIPLGGGEGQGSQADTVVVFSVESENGADSSVRAQQELDQTMSFGHTRVMVFSEAFARKGMEQYFDYLRRLPDLRRLKWVAVSEGSAAEVIRARPALDRVPALFLNDMLDDAVRTGRLPETNVGDFMIRASNKGGEPVVPVIRMAGPDRPELAGLAVFRDYRMVGKLTPEETLTYLALRGIKKGAGLLHVTLPEGGEADLASYSRGMKQKLRWQNGRVYAHISLEVETDLLQLSSPGRSSDPGVIQALERSASAELKRRAEVLVTKLQTEFGADVLAVGERVRAYLPDAWAQIDDWSSAFARARFSFDVKVHVRRTGMATD